MPNDNDLIDVYRAMCTSLGHDDAATLMLLLPHAYWSYVANRNALEAPGGGRWEPLLHPSAEQLISLHRSLVVMLDEKAADYMMCALPSARWGVVAAEHGIERPSDST